MYSDELIILVSWYESKDQAEIDCFEQNMRTFKEHNPRYRISCVKSGVESSSDCYSSMDIILLQWYRHNKSILKAERYLLINWACWCDLNLKEYYKSVWNTDVVAPSILYPERNSWYWFKTINQLPVRAKLFATGVLPFCGILVSEKAMNAISMEIWKPDYVNLESELRFATIATMLGFDPVPIPLCSRSMTWKENVPFDSKYKGLHHPRKKIAKKNCLDFIEKYFDQTDQEIPKIFHQTWKTEIIPDSYSKAVNSWKTLHPDWDFILWTDEMNRVFIENYFPDFLLIYDSYPYSIQRVDAVRYFILFKLGGVFIDLDFECLKNIEPLINKWNCSFGMEPAVHAQQKNIDFLICNAFMAATPSNIFFKEITGSLFAFDVNRKHYFFDVLESTGPAFLTEVFLKYNDKSHINVIPSEHIYPLNANETASYLKGDVDKTMSAKTAEAYAVHYFSGTWMPD